MESAGSKCQRHSVAQCRSMSHCVAWCHTVLLGVPRCHTVSHGVIQCHTVSLCVTLCCSVSHCVAQCHTVLLGVTLCCSVSLSFTLYHAATWISKKLYIDLVVLINLCIHGPRLNIRFHRSVSCASVYIPLPGVTLTHTLCVLYMASHHRCVWCREHVGCHGQASCATGTCTLHTVADSKPQHPSCRKLKGRPDVNDSYSACTFLEEVLTL